MENKPMDRIYKNAAVEPPRFFRGIEVEHTPMHGRPTLFVVGIQPVADVLNSLTPDTKHVYCGANQSFHPSGPTEWESWDDMISKLLQKDLWVTLDFDVKYAESLQDSYFTEYRRFIPMISVKIPYIKLFNHNATVKIDDIGFDKTNPGVWCHSLHSLTSPAQLTEWDKYTDDTVI